MSPFATSSLWIPVLSPWAQVLALQACLVHYLKDLNSICFHQFLIRRGIQTWKTALKLGLCYKQHIFLTPATISQFFVCSWISQGCVPAAHWLTTLAFSVLNQRHAGCFPGRCLCPTLQILSSGCLLITPAGSASNSMMYLGLVSASSSLPHPYYS